MSTTSAPFLPVFSVYKSCALMTEVCYIGAGGIRTLGAVSRTPHFQCGPFSHSDTAPRCLIAMNSTAAMRIPAPCECVTFGQ